MSSVLVWPHCKLIQLTETVENEPSEKVYCQASELSVFTAQPGEWLGDGILYGSQ